VAWCSYNILWYFDAQNGMLLFTRHYQNKQLERQSVVSDDKIARWNRKLQDKPTSMWTINALGWNITGPSCHGEYSQWLFRDVLFSPISISTLSGMSYRFITHSYSILTKRDRLIAITVPNPDSDTMILFNPHPGSNLRSRLFPKVTLLFELLSAVHTENFIEIVDHSTRLSSKRCTTLRHTNRHVVLSLASNLSRFDATMT